MFAISPRYTDDNSLFRLVDDLVHPWDVYRSPLFNNREGALSHNSGRLGDSEVGGPADDKFNNIVIIVKKTYYILLYNIIYRLYINNIII